MDRDGGRIPGDCMLSDVIMPPASAPTRRPSGRARGWSSVGAQADSDPVLGHIQALKEGLTMRPEKRHKVRVQGFS